MLNIEEDHSKGNISSSLGLEMSKRRGHYEFSCCCGRVRSACGGGGNKECVQWFLLSRDKQILSLIMSDKGEAGP